ncbi:MAG: metal-dependent hydrolase [Bacteroidota bacterium]|nr:metal-dependent hydrolase [Bacteroidota bacterium]
MTGRTHDLAALTTLTMVVATQPLLPISIGTLFTAIAANLIGAAAPDLDQPTGKLWRKIPAGTILGKILNPFFGTHRSISHSLWE